MATNSVPHEALYDETYALRSALRRLRTEVRELRELATAQSALIDRLRADHERAVARLDAELARLRGDVELLRDALFPTEMVPHYEDYGAIVWEDQAVEVVDPYADAPDPADEDIRVDDLEPVEVNAS